MQAGNLPATRRSVLRLPLVPAIAASLPLLLLSSCSSAPRPHVTTAALPLTVCGQVLWNGDAGAPPVLGYFQPGDYQASESLPVGRRPLILRFSRNCTTGVHAVALSPATRLAQLAVARAKNGAVVAVAVYGLNAGPATVTVVRQGGRSTNVHLNITAL